MKTHLLFTFLNALFLSCGAFGQAFGPDVIIQPDTVNERNVEIAAAFNGWLFSATSLESTASDMGGIAIRKSIDGGYTWTQIDQYFVAGVRYETHDIVVTGTDTNNLSLFLVGAVHSLAANTYTLYVDHYNATTNSFMGSPYHLAKGTNRVNDVEIASDYKMPALGTAPYSVALLYSSYGAVSDSIISVVSLDGGATFGTGQTVGTTFSYTRNVTLDYGRGNSASNGRYFAAWEQLGNFTARTGHIYTSRNVSQVVDAWIQPVNLDSLSSTMINLCRNPRIAIQHNDADNDSMSITAVVTVDRDYNGDGSDYDMLGFCNKRAHFTNFWYRFDVDNSGNNDFQSDVIFDDSTSMFRMVYMDSTNHELKYAANDMNLTSASGWVTVQSGMNDIPAITRAPMPRIAFRPGAGEIALAWIDEDTLTGKGIAKFDLQSFMFAGVSELSKEFDAQLYPNPVKHELFIGLEDAIAQLPTQLLITDLNGRIVKNITISGQTQLSVLVDDFSTGTYLLKLTNAQGFASRLFVKE